MENITTEVVMEILDILKERFRKIDEFGLGDMGRIQTDAGTQFTCKNLKDGVSIRGVRLVLEAPYYQKKMTKLK